MVNLQAFILFFILLVKYRTLKLPLNKTYVAQGKYNARAVWTLQKICIGGFYFDSWMTSWKHVEQLTKNINAVCTLKNVTGYSEKKKNAGDHSGTVDCTSKIHSSTLGSRVWSKGDCGPFQPPPAVIVNVTSSGASIEELKRTFCPLLTCCTCT